jgi:hypothetical protein
MQALPPTAVHRNPIVTPVYDALHFRHGIQNMPCIDFEVEIPIPVVNDVRNWGIVREAWWTIICDYYGTEEMMGRPSSCSYPPLTLALEMRINGGSNMIMSSQRGNDATMSIEVLSHNVVNSGEWNRYIQRLFDKLCAICHRYGVGNKIRPHWAKQWQGMKWTAEDGTTKVDVAKFMRKTAYVDAIPEFLGMIDVIGRSVDDGKMPYSSQDCKNHFSNALLDYVIWEEGNPPPLQTILENPYYTVCPLIPSNRCSVN